jgi:hypothetical protein
MAVLHDAKGQFRRAFDSVSAAYLLSVCRVRSPSIWLVTRRRCSSCFDLGGNTLELLEQLVRGNIRQNESTAHNPAHFSGLTSRGFFKSRLRESYDEIAMDHGNSSNFVCEYFPFVQRVF